MTPARVEWHLENWATWQRSYHIGLGMPGRASCMASTGLTDFQDMCEAGDSYAAKATDAVLESLTPAQRGAIERNYGICSVYLFPRHNYIDMLRCAMERLPALLSAQGLV